MNLDNARMDKLAELAFLESQALKDVRVSREITQKELLDISLLGVDPFDPDLSVEVQARVATECKVNPGYFFREVLRNSVEADRKLTEEEIDLLCKKHEKLTEEFLESLGYKRVVSISAPREVKVQPLHPHISNTPFL